jgi:hypothetical protein
MPLRRKPRRQESALYLHLLVDNDIHLPVFPRSSVLLICTGGQLSQHRDYGEITGGQNALLFSTVDSLCDTRETCTFHSEDLPLHLS